MWKLNLSRNFEFVWKTLNLSAKSLISEKKKKKTLQKKTLHSHYRSSKSRTRTCIKNEMPSSYWLPISGVWKGQNLTKLMNSRYHQWAWHFVCGWLWFPRIAFWHQLCLQILELPQSFKRVVVDGGDVVTVQVSVKETEKKERKRGSFQFMASKLSLLEKEGLRQETAELRVCWGVAEGEGGGDYLQQS